MNNKSTILGKTYGYGYDGRDHVETISVPLYLDGKGYDIELNVYGQGQTAEEADIDAKKAETRLIEELRRIVGNYDIEKELEFVNELVREKQGIQN